MAVLTTETLQDDPPSPFVPVPPRFDDARDERRHRKERLAAAHRLFARNGYAEGIAGHHRARDPIEPDTFWVGPFGHHFAEVSCSTLVRVDHEGRVVQGDGEVNQAAFVIHSSIHRARPEVTAVAHAHPIAGKAWAALGRLLDPIGQEACVFFEDHALSEPYSGIVLDLDEAERLTKALGHHKATILRNHGLLTVGRTVDEAAWWLVAMDDCCKVQLAAEAVGAQTLIDTAVAREARRAGGTPQLGWFKFQPYWRRMVREEPDLLG